MEHNSNIFGQVSGQAPLTNHCPPSAFAAMLERHSSFCTEMMRWPHLSRWDQLEDGCRRGSFFCSFHSFYQSPLKIDDGPNSISVSIPDSRLPVDLFTHWPNHNSTNFNRRRLVTVTVFRRPTVITVPQHRRGPYSIHQLPWQFLSQKGNVCVRTHTSGGDIRLVKE